MAIKEEIVANLPPRKEQVTHAYFFVLIIIIIGEIVQFIVGLVFTPILGLGWVAAWAINSFIYTHLILTGFTWAKMHEVTFIDRIKRMLGVAIVSFLEILPTSFLPSMTFGFLILGFFLRKENNKENEKIDQQRRAIQNQFARMKPIYQARFQARLAANDNSPYSVDRAA